MDKQHGIDIKINNTETMKKPLIRISPIHMQHGIGIKKINDTDTTEKILEEFYRKIKEMQEEFNRKLKEERAATDKKLKEERAANAAVNLKLKKELDFLIFLNHFSRLCRSLEECITVCDDGTLLYRPYQPMIQN